MKCQAQRRSLPAVASLLAVALACAPSDAVEKAERSVRLTLDAPMAPVRPGEVVSIPYTIKNMRPQPLLLVINQGETGGHFAAKTLTHQVIDASTGKVISRSDFAGKGCPVGEGLAKNNFHKVAGGEEHHGVVNVRWNHSPVVPVELPRNVYRLQVTYARPMGMAPGQFDDEASRILWKEADAVTSNTATAILRVADWDEAATRALAKRISAGDAAAMRTARIARLESVASATEQALFDFEYLPVGEHYDFRMAAVSFFESVPFPLASGPLLRVVRTEKFDGVYQVKYRAIHSLGSFPEEVVGPWAVDQFRRHDDRLLRDKLLGVLSECKFKTDDEAISAYMLNEVRTANPDRFSSSTASFMLSACEALGGENTRPVVLAIRDRISDVKSKDQYARFVKQIDALLQAE